MDIKDLLIQDKQFRYMMLDRMRMDCEYYLGNGNRFAKQLWAGDEVHQMAYMKALWNSFPEDGKPEWLPYEKILEYEKEMCPRAILVERDYKGEYERFALTPEEFEKEFPETVAKGAWPVHEADTDTIAPLVHIWFAPCVVGDAAWIEHFTDMEQGLPPSDIENGNLAYVREDFMQSLKKYLPEEEKAPLAEQIGAAEAVRKDASQDVASGRAQSVRQDAFVKE